MSGYGFTSSGQPSRPYSSSEQVPRGAAPRSAEFTTGTTGDNSGNAALALSQDHGLTLNGLQFNAQVPDGVRPTSVLQPIMRNPGGLGMSADDAARRTVDGTYLGSINGTSESSFEPAAMLRLSGLDAE